MQEREVLGNFSPSDQKNQETEGLALRVKKPSCFPPLLAQGKELSARVFAQRSGQRAIAYTATASGYGGEQDNPHT